MFWEVDKEYVSMKGNGIQALGTDICFTLEYNYNLQNLTSPFIALHDSLGVRNPLKEKQWSSLILCVTEAIKSPQTILLLLSL